MLELRTSVNIPQDVFNREPVLSLQFGAMASSEIYWNGELLLANGKPALKPEEEIPGKLDTSTYIPASRILSGENSIRIVISSHHNLIEVATPIHYLSVVESLQAQARIAQYYLPALLMIGAFVLAALYFGVLGIVDASNRSSLIIAGMAFFAGMQLLAETARAFFLYDYPLQVVRLLIIIVCAAGFSSMLVTYLARRFSTGPAYYTVATGLAFAVLGISFFEGFDGRALMAIFAPFCVGLGIAIKATRDRQKGALPITLLLAASISSIVIGGQYFLDILFYFVAGSLISALLVDQAREMRRIKLLKDEMKGRAVKLELELLKRRIAPHFLMNTLNALAEWVEEDPKVGVRMIEVLAEEFRLLSQMSHKSLVPLSDEIALCKYHLEVMSYRVNKAFKLKVNTENNAVQIPPGILHTLIENAFTHGRYVDGAEFRISETNAGEEAALVVTIPEPESRVSDKEQGGEGLAYVVARLEEAFGNSVTFSDGFNADGCWETRISIVRPMS